DPVKPLGVDTTNPVGSVSENASPVRVMAASGLVIVNVRGRLSPTPMLASPNAFVITGPLAVSTVRDAVEVFPVPVDDVTCTELFFTPAVVPVTFMENVHEALGARVAPESETVPDPAVAVIVPPPQL